MQLPDFASPLIIIPTIPTTPLNVKKPPFIFLFIIITSAYQIPIYLLSSSFLFLFNHVAPKHKEVEHRHRYITPILTSLVKFNIPLTQKSKDIIKYNNAVILFLFIMCTPSNSELSFCSVIIECSFQRRLRWDN